MRNARIVLLVAAALLVPGISVQAAQYGIPDTATSSDTLDPSDPCGKQHVDFATSQSYYFNKVAQGVVTGALGGALTGALTSMLLGGKPGTGAAVGAVAGGAAGGAQGAAEADQQQGADQAALSQATYNNVNAATTQLDRTNTTFGLLRNCRFVYADNTKAQLRANQITRDEAARRLSDQKRRFDDEIALARKYGIAMADQEKKFQTTSDALVKQDPQARQALAARPPQGQSGGGGDMVPMVAATSAAVREDPKNGARRIATLDEGEHVNAGPSERGWRQVELEDGKTGFVTARSVKPEGGGGGGQRTARAKPKANTGNVNADIKVAATESLPEKRRAYDDAVDKSARQSELTFNVDTPPSGGG